VAALVTLSFYMSLEHDVSLLSKDYSLCCGTKKKRSIELTKEEEYGLEFF